MFLFFTNKKWFLWSYIGTIVVLSFLWLQVKIDVEVNAWFGEFYDLIQKALGEPGSITATEYWSSLASFAKLAAMGISLGLASAFITAHYLFRWRTSMVEWYHSVYDKASKIEGASQRVQEDTVKFSKILENLGTSFIESIMVLVQFFPILMGLSTGIVVLWFDDWAYGLAFGALIWSLGGTILLMAAGYFLRLVGIEYDLQKREAAYRKLLVIYEDDENIRPKNLEELYDDVRKISYESYLKYLYFNIVRLAYLQANVLSAYVLLAPAIISGMITLGVMQQIIRAFGRVEGSLQYLLKSWPLIIEFLSVVKRLKEFEREIKNNSDANLKIET